MRPPKPLCEARRARLLCRLLVSNRASIRESIHASAARVRGALPIHFRHLRAGVAVDRVGRDLEGELPAVVHLVVSSFEFIRGSMGLFVGLSVGLFPSSAHLRASEAVDRVGRDLKCELPAVVHGVGERVEVFALWRGANT